MLQMILRKLLNNRWLAISLLLGLVVAVGLVSSIPAFTAGVLQRLLTKELEAYQQTVKHFPGGLLVSINRNELHERDGELFDRVSAYLDEQVVDSLGVPLYDRVTVLRTIPYAAVRSGQPGPAQAEEAPLYALSGLAQHIELVDGRLPEKEPVDGVYEALVTEKALKERKMVLGSVYELSQTRGGQTKGQTILVKPVGAFSEKAGNDPYWFAAASEYTKGFVLDDELFRQSFLQEKNQVTAARMYVAFRYQSFRVNDKEKLMSVVPAIEGYLQKQGLKKSEFGVNFPVSSILNKYEEQSQKFRTILWSLYIPIFVMLGLYLVMVAGLIVERQRTEIAVLGSRGAGRMQVIAIYLVELVILGAVALLIGPFAGVGLSKLLGVSNGFLQFVDRTSLDISLDGDVFAYAGWTVLGCVALILGAVVLATRQNIVTHKQAAARMTGTSIWHRLFLDVWLLLIAGYGWYSCQNSGAGNEGQGIFSVDFLLFFVPVLFSLGFGLLCLRLYPLLIRMVQRLGRRIWPLSLHTALVQVGRASRQYQFLMLFVTITVAVGMFSASTARTINQNAEEQIRYGNGADVRFQADWNSDEVKVLLHRGPRSGGEGAETDVNVPEAPPIQYEEPDFAPYTRLPGVKHAAKVYVNELAEARYDDDKVSEVTLMGIDPKEFGQTVWWKPALLPHHLNEYLNLLAKEPSAVVISRSLAEQLGVSEGQTIEMGWKQSRKVEVIVYAIVDYWPGWSPVPEQVTYGKKEHSYLIVANLPFVQDKMRVEPYEVWLKMKPDASSEDLYAGLSGLGVRLVSLDNARQKLIELKNSAFYLGLNGALTLGFLLSMLITFLGYILYWVLTLGARKLQYGVFRAMGMPFGQLTRILAWEQLLTFGWAFFMGMTAGKLANLLFLPALGLYLQAQMQVPPFAIVTNKGDEWVIQSFVGLTLLTGVAILCAMLSRLQIHQAVKLGED
ncbi:FtsX-like permease family protein [Brevibacillus sp. GCM10020057]|uniref:FtsX-like permease family protein n=1 Tax=Brevibacillus sp. GCM10020057 TaxID=3317327 RepID=UPI003628EC11